VYTSAWGAGAREIVGVRLPRGVGIAGGVIASGVGEAIPDARTDSRFAARIAQGTGYVPHTMLVVPLRRGEVVIGALSVLDRRDGRQYRQDEVERASLFADLATKALNATPDMYTGLGLTRAPR
jgi:GAF domain-containing protein